MADQEHSPFSFLKKIPKKIIEYAVLGVIVLVVVIAGYFWLKGKPPQVVTVVRSSLQSMEEKSDLSVMSSDYSAVATVYKDKEKKKPDYYIWYKGQIEMKIDFSEVTVDYSEDNKTILITVPPVSISKDISEDIEFLPAPPNDEKILTKARTYANEDLEERIKTDVKLQQLADKNAVDLISGFTKPLVGKDYRVQVKIAEPEQESEETTDTEKKEGTENEKKD